MESLDIGVQCSTIVNMSAAKMSNSKMRFNGAEKLAVGHIAQREPTKPSEVSREKMHKKRALQTMEKAGVPDGEGTNGRRLQVDRCVMLSSCTGEMHARRKCYSFV